MSQDQKVCFINTTGLDEEFFTEQLGQAGVTTDFIGSPLEDIDAALNGVDAECTILCVDHLIPVSQNLIAKLPALKLIVTRSTGFNHIDTAAASQRGIAVANVPSYGEHTVAEFAFTLLLALTRKLRPAIEQIESGEMDYSKLQGIDLAGKTMGVIGTGRIGGNALRIAHGFGMELLGYDPYPNQQLVADYGVKYVELNELLEVSDVVSLHAPSTPDNFHIINTNALDRMKPSAVLINTARGDLIDTGALVKALTNGQIAGAGLDVMEGENLFDIDEEIKLIKSRPHKRELSWAADQSVLLKMPNVICTPHNAFNTVGALERIRQTTADNIKAFVAGEVQNEVKPRS